MNDDVASSKSELFVVDGTNVCCWFGQAFKHRDTGIDKISVRPLLVLLCEIREHGDDFYCIFDASTSSLIRQQGNPGEARLIDCFVRDYSRWFYRVTGATRADSAILHYADKFNRRIITNDIYRDYRDKIAWLNDRHTDRLVHGNFQRTGLMTLEKFSYGFMEVEWTIWTRDLVQRLRNCLANDFDWKAFQASKEVALVERSQPPVIEVSDLAPASIVEPKQQPQQTRTRKSHGISTSKKAEQSTVKKTRQPTAKKKTKTKSTVKRAKTRVPTQANNKSSRRPQTKPKKNRRRRKSPPRKKSFLARLFG